MGTFVEDTNPASPSMRHTAIVPRVLVCKVMQDFDKSKPFVALSGP